MSIDFLKYINCECYISLNLIKACFLVPIVSMFANMNWKVNISMLEHTKTHPIDNSYSIPWREAFPDLVANEIGTCLVGARKKQGLTQKALSELTGILRRHISEMENGKCLIDKITAKKLSVVLGIDYKVFL